jgi:hypothetical protein
MTRTSGRLAAEVARIATTLLTDDIARPTPRERDVIRRPMGHPPGPTTCTAVRGARPLRKKVVSSQRTTKAKARRSHLLATFNV